MLTFEKEVTKREHRDDLIRLLEERVKCSTPSVYTTIVQSAFGRCTYGIENACDSISLSPPHKRSRLAFCLPSNKDGIYSDWAAVGHDLYASILKYTMTEQYLRVRSANAESEADCEWSIQNR